MLPGMGEAVTAHFFEAAAVLNAAPNLIGLGSLKAFSTSRLRGRRWSMALVEGWNLIFSIDDTPPPSVLLEELVPRPQAVGRAR